MKFSNMVDILLFIQRNGHTVRTASTSSLPAAKLHEMIEDYLGDKGKYTLEQWSGAINDYLATPRGKQVKV